MEMLFDLATWNWMALVSWATKMLFWDTDHGEESNNVFFIFSELLEPVWVRKQDCFFCGSEGDGPLSM